MNYKNAIFPYEISNFDWTALLHRFLYFSKVVTQKNSIERAENKFKQQDSGNLKSAVQLAEAWMHYSTGSVGSIAV